MLEDGIESRVLRQLYHEVFELRDEVGKEVLMKELWMFSSAVNEL